MDISFRSHRIETKSYDIPLFMNEGQSDAIVEIVDTFENSLGLKENQFDSNFIFDIFSDAKVAKGIYFILTKYFYDLKGFEKTNFSPSDLRIKLYELMEQKNLSWANHRQQGQLYEILSEIEAISILDLEELLYADFSENFKVVRRSDSKPKVLDIIKHYNTEILKFILNKSFSLKFKVNNYENKGNFIKNVIKNCKLLGLAIDLDILEENTIKILLVTILGPNELVGRNVKYSNNLFFFFNRILESFNKELHEVIIEIQYFDTKKTVLLPLNDFPNIIDDSKEELVYDSAIEKQFSEKWCLNFPHWEIEREPLIVEGSIVMVPDFLLRYKSKFFYLEIVGFWTERYLTKKSMKVSILKSKYPNMILLVDKKLDWPQIDVATFFYDNKKVPILEIGHFLKKFEEEEFSSLIMNANFEQIRTELENAMQKNTILDLDFLFGIFKVSWLFELNVLVIEYFRRFKTTSQFVYFSKYGFLIPISLLTEAKKVISSMQVNNSLTMHKLKHQFSFIPEMFLKVLLNYLGYDFRYKSLLEEEIVFKKNSKIKSEIV